jgi:hypothetical protein
VKPVRRTETPTGVSAHAYLPHPTDVPTGTGLPRGATVHPRTGADDRYRPTLSPA